MDDILAQPEMRAATDELDRDSQLDDPENHHIEGAFIVGDTSSGLSGYPPAPPTS